MVKGKLTNWGNKDGNKMKSMVKGSKLTDGEDRRVEKKRKKTWEAASCGRRKGRRKNSFVGKKESLMRPVSEFHTVKFWLTQLFKIIIK